MEKRLNPLTKAIAEKLNYKYLDFRKESILSLPRKKKKALKKTFEKMYNVKLKF
jgi:hypothetical protein